MKKFITVALCAISCVAVFVSCGKKKNASDGSAAASENGITYLDCRLPNSNLVVESAKVDPTGTFMEKYEQTQIEKNKAAWEMINAACSDFLGQEFLDGVRAFYEKEAAEKNYPSKGVFNLDASAVTLDMFDDETPDRFLASLKLLGYIRFDKNMETNFLELLAVLAKSPVFELTDYNCGVYGGKKVRFVIPEDMNEDNIVLPEYALVCGNGGREILFGVPSVVEDAVNGKLTAAYSAKVTNALSYVSSDKGTCQFAIVPEKAWLDIATENAHDEYAQLVSDFCSLTVATTLKNESEDIKVALRFGKPENAVTLQALAESGLGFVKMMAVGALEGKELPLLQTLKLETVDVATILSFSITAKDMETITALLEEVQAGANQFDDDEWTDDDEDDWSDDDSDDEWTDEDEAELEDDAA